MEHFNIKLLLGIFIFSLLAVSQADAQNSMVGDGFGGRLWYSPTNYANGSYSAYCLCSNGCESSNNQLYGWGSDIYNQLGTIGNTATSTPIPIPNMSNVKFYTAGYMMGAIKNDNTGWTWGITAGGANLGIDGNPVQVISDATFVDASSSTVSFIKSDGTVWSIGINNGGNFGDGTVGDPNLHIYTPIQMININNAVRVAANWKSTIVLLADSTLVSCGYGPQLGLGLGVFQTTTPLPIQGLPKIIDVKADQQSILALAANGDVYYWGNYNNPTPFDLWTPVKIDSLSDIIAISGCDDGGHFLLLDKNKNCYAFGENFGGQCGVSSSTHYFIPYSQPELVETDVVDILAGESFSYVVKSDGSLWGCGQSESGSIWLDLSNEQRDYYAELNPSSFPEICQPYGLDITATSCSDSTIGSITINAFGGALPYSYSIGGEPQSENIFNYLDTGLYQITVVDNQGCIINDTAHISGTNCPEIPNWINFPNVFTPNNDGINEFFKFESSGVVELSLTILNRWGNVIKVAEGYDASWDGRTESDELCSEGVYFYVVQYQFINGERYTRHGHVTLIR